jgi:hypothetical protein
MRLDIEALADDHDCETCGTCYATGWAVVKDSEPWFTLKPVAHCYGGIDYSETDLMKEILSRLLPDERVIINIGY